MIEQLATLKNRIRTAEGQWSPSELRHLVEAVADRPDLWPDEVTRVEDGRSYRLVYRDEIVEVWIISWDHDTVTEIHDHGGSAGAMRMVHGSLTETFVVRGGVHRRVLRADCTTSFSSTYVHDVRNELKRSALSVQAYSPPLTEMTYYELVGSVAVPVRTERVKHGAPA